MKIVSETDHTEETLKAQLEELYAAASYLHAENGRLNILVHLIGAAVAELEGLVEDRAAPVLRLVVDKDLAERKKG